MLKNSTTSDSIKKSDWKSVKIIAAEIANATARENNALAKELQNKLLKKLAQLEKNMERNRVYWLQRQIIWKTNKKGLSYCLKLMKSLVVRKIF